MWRCSLLSPIVAIRPADRRIMAAARAVNLQPFRDLGPSDTAITDKQDCPTFLVFSGPQILSQRRANFDQVANELRASQLSIETGRRHGKEPLGPWNTNNLPKYRDERA